VIINKTLQTVRKKKTALASKKKSELLCGKKEHTVKKGGKSDKKASIAKAEMK